VLDKKRGREVKRQVHHRESRVVEGSQRVREGRRGGRGRSHRGFEGRRGVERIDHREIEVSSRRGVEGGRREGSRVVEGRERMHCAKFSIQIHG